jgi:AcrR family transcriptional regulator
MQCIAAASEVAMATTQTADIMPAEAHDDGAKRRQILDGARTVFFAQGFDAASMGEIARAAGVSKGTLYVYFQNKEELFSAIVERECSTLAENVFNLDREDHDVAAVLTRIGNGYAGMLCHPRKMAAFRAIIAIAARMPAAGKEFFEAGPARGAAALSAYLQAQVEAGILAIDDCDVAASQFLDSCQATMLKPVLLNFGDPPTPERIAYVAGIAVRTFLAAYQRR